jgi:hypothetical protein
MKSALLLIAGIFSAYILVASPIGVNEKVKTVFNKTFANVNNVEWYEDDHAYTAHFTQNDIATYIKYDEDGNFMGSRRYYKGDHLPIDVRVKLNNRYPGKNIFIVTELTVGDVVNYFVKLEDEKYWYTIKVDEDRQIERLDRYLKG